MSSRESCSPPASQDCQRKRIARACEGCRLRKTKCDGGKPCRKCKASNIICTTWRSKKPKDKVYAKGYVDVLERRQTQLIAGLEDTYHRLVAARLWPGKELPEPSGHPLVHDILSVLQILETNEEDSDADETNEHEAEHKQSTLDSAASPTCSDSSNMRVTQSPSAEDCALQSNGRTIAPRPTSAAPITPAQSTPSRSESLLSPIRISGTDSSLPKSQAIVPDSPLQTFQTKTPTSSIGINPSSEPAWADMGASFNNSIIIPGTPESCSPWDHQYSPEMTDLPMDLDFSLPAESFENSTLLQMQDQAKNSSNSQWWLNGPESQTQFTEPMSTGGMDELSNMLYRDMCSDSSLMEMYQEEFGLVNMDGNEGLV